MKVSWDQIKAQFNRDKKKSVALLVLLVVLAGAVGRLLVNSTAPQEVAAMAPVATRAVAPAGQDVIRPSPQATASSPAEFSKNAVTPPAPERTVTQKKAATITGISRELTRNPFDTHEWKRFKRAIPLIDTDKKPKDKGEAPDLFEKIRRQFSDFQQVRQQETTQFREALGKLQLQSTLTGPSRSAYISGKLVHEGDMLDGFTVQRIADGEVRLNRGGMSGVIRMQ